MKKEIKHVGEDFIRITTEDERWYIGSTPKFNKKGLPILKNYVSQGWVNKYQPKDKWFYKWLMKQGEEATEIRDDKAVYGSKVHQGTEDLDAGIKIKHDSKYLNSRTGEEEELTTQEFEALMSYVDFMDANEYEVLGVEKVVRNENSYFQIEDEEGEVKIYGIAGTCDRILRATGEDQELEKGIWVIDIKTGKYVHDTHENQVSFYGHSVNWKALGITEEEWENRRLAVLQVGYWRNKNKHWKLTEIEDKWERFCHVFQLWKDDNPLPKPKQKEYPLYIQRDSRLSGEQSVLKNLKIKRAEMKDAITTSLIDAGYKTLGELADNLEEVAEIKGIGAKRMAYIKKVLKAKGVI